MISINLTQLQTNTDLSPVVIKTCKQIITNPYYTLGEFCEELTNDELDNLITHTELLVNCKKGDPSNPEHPLHGSIKTIGLLAIMLAEAEGTTDIDEQVSKEIIDTLTVMLSLEALCRDELIILHHNLITFFEDHEIAKKTNAPRVPLED